MKHRGWIESVYDGDTFWAWVELIESYPPDMPENIGIKWRELRPNLKIQHRQGPLLNPGLRERIRIRLLGIDAPEMRGEEKAAGQISAQWVRDELASFDHVKIDMLKTDSFGRWLCDVEYGGIDLALAMLNARQAKVYTRSRGPAVEIMKVPW